MNSKEINTLNQIENQTNLLSTLESQDLALLTPKEIEELQKLVAISGKGCLEFDSICQILDYQWPVLRKSR